MLESHDKVSDLNVTVDKPLQVESFGELVPVPVDPPIEKLTPFQTEIFALNLIRRPAAHRAPAPSTARATPRTTLPDKARFRVNIFSQRGNFSIVLRKLKTNIPTIESAQAARDLQEDAAREERADPRHRRHRLRQDDHAGRAAQRDQRHQVGPHRHAGGSRSSTCTRNRKATFNQRELGTGLRHVRQRPARGPAPGAQGHPRRRDARPRDGGAGAQRRGDGPPRARPRCTRSTPARPSTASSACSTQDEEKQIRQRLADTVRWVVGQRLVPKVGGGRWAVHDILANTIRSNELILQRRAGGQDLLRDPGGRRAVRHDDLRPGAAALLRARASSPRTRRSTTPRARRRPARHRHDQAEARREDHRRRGAQARHRLQPESGKKK